MYKTVITCISICLLLLIVSCDQFGEPSQKQTPPSPDQVENLLKKVTEYEVAHQDPTAEQGPSWQLCAFYIGAMEAYKATNDALYHDLALRWAQAKNWQFRRPRHADYQCIGQVYLELHLLNSAPHRIKATQTTFDNILSDPRPGDIAWHWADALFMAPPVLSRLAEATGDTTYLDFMSQQFWEASAPLYDSSHHLYYRDERYVDRETEHGKDVFWARGNGWVLAGLARILQFLPPDHPSHGKFVNRFRDMATVVTQLQSNDGFWRTSLLDPTEYPAPESSGTGLFCYALAWGINEGYLNAERYQPVVLKAWHALTEATNDEGRVGWVQEPGSRPGPVSPDDTGAYGAGAFLMAGSEVIDMMENKQ